MADRGLLGRSHATYFNPLGVRWRGTPAPRAHPRPINWVRRAQGGFDCDARLQPMAMSA